PTCPRPASRAGRRRRSTAWASRASRSGRTAIRCASRRSRRGSRASPCSIRPSFTPRAGARSATPASSSGTEAEPRSPTRARTSRASSTTSSRSSAALSRHLKVDLRVDFERRHAIERNHTATHLLHAALRQVLGASARQAGSLVAPDRLRFDFTYHRGMLEPEIRQVEDLVNEWIRRAVATDFRFRSYQEAVAAGAMALFGEKYADVVRTVEVPGFSLELCGGCHVGNTGQIGLFLSESERGIASGVRRIEAVTGTGALDAVRDQRAAYDGLIDALGIKAADAVQQRERAAQLRARQTELETEVRKLRLQLVSGGGGASGTDDETIDVEGVRLLAREVPPAPADDLRAMADALRSKLGSGVVILGAREDGNVSLIAAVTKDLTERVRAGELVKKLSAIVGGRGGGRADFAQAGGKQPENLPAALAAAGDAVREQLAGVKT